MSHVQSHIPCAVCGSHEVDVVAEADRDGRPLRNVLCRECGLVWVDPRPSDEELAKFYAEDYRASYKGAAEPKKKHCYREMLRANLRVARLREFYKPGDHLLDVGAGAGFFAYAAVCWAGLMSTAAGDALGVATALLGLALVGAMSRIYMLRTVPAWNSVATPISFVATALLLGALGLAAQVVGTGGPGAGEPIRDLVGSATVLGGALVAVVLLTTLVHGMRLRRMGGAAAESFRIVFLANRALLVLRAALAVVGVGLFALSAVWVIPSVAMLGFAMVLGGEILGRLLFFAAHRRVGL